MPKQFALIRASMIASASADPSSGSVPAPISSISTSAFSLTRFKISTMFFMCEEKVERLCSILCSSPMSQKISLKTDSSLDSSQGTKIPVIIIAVSSPVSFIVTVFPPVFGPVISKKRYFSPSRTVTGTTFSAAISGCLPLMILMTPFALIAG